MFPVLMYSFAVPWKCFYCVRGLVLCIPFRLAKGRPERYVVKLFTKIVPSRSAAGVEGSCEPYQGNDCAAIPHNMWTKIKAGAKT